MNFNIRKLQNQIVRKQAQLRRAAPNTRERIRLELKAKKIALQIAVANRDDKRKSAA